MSAIAFDDADTLTTKFDDTATATHEILMMASTVALIATGILGSYFILGIGVLTGIVTVYNLSQKVHTLNKKIHDKTEESNQLNENLNRLTETQNSLQETNEALSAVVDELSKKVIDLSSHVGQAQQGQSAQLERLSQLVDTIRSQIADAATTFEAITTRKTEPAILLAISNLRNLQKEIEQNFTHIPENTSTAAAP